MNKKYIIPTIMVYNVKTVILEGSVGVKSDNSLGNEYNSEDESYIKYSFATIYGGWGEEE